MSEGERKLVDAAGDYAYAVRDGDRVAEPSWRSCRLLLTDERLVLATGEDRQAVPHSRIVVPENPALPDWAEGDGLTPLEVGDSVLTVDVDADGFEAAYCRAALHDEVILARSPAVVGGVVQEDAEWSKARFRLTDGRVRLGFPGGRTAGFAVDDVGTVEETERGVAGETRRVVEVEHTDADGRSVQTHLSGAPWHTRALAALLCGAVEDREAPNPPARGHRHRPPHRVALRRRRDVEDREDDDYDLTDTESEVLMALYSGVSPFEMADFVGLDVEQVEEIYQRLLEVGAVDKVRERTEVALNATGRNLASKEMSER